MSKIVPETTRLAAKRAFVRTAAQTLSSVIPTTGIVVALTGDWLLAAGLGALSAVVSSALAGTAAYTSMIAKGIPEEYSPTE